MDLQAYALWGLGCFAERVFMLRGLTAAYITKISRKHFSAEKELARC